MPTYQYACKDCGHQFEQVQAFSDPSLTACPNCQGALRKVFGSVGVVFKGSGFYRTDSRSGPNKASLSPAHKSDSSGGGEASSSGSDSSGAAANGAKKDTTSQKATAGSSSPAASSASSPAPAKAAS